MTHSGGKSHLPGGDRGQRYEVQLRPFPDSGAPHGLKALGYTDNETFAKKMLQAALLWSIIGAARIYDRKPT